MAMIKQFTVDENLEVQIMSLDKIGDEEMGDCIISYIYDRIPYVLQYDLVKQIFGFVSCYDSLCSKTFYDWEHCGSDANMSIKLALKNHKVYCFNKLYDFKKFIDH